MTISALMDLGFYGVTGAFMLAGLVNVSGSPVVRAVYRLVSASGTGGVYMPTP